MEDGLSLVDGVWTVTYPWKRDPKDLPDNKPTALAVLKSTEKRLLKNSARGELYKEQIQDMVTRGVARQLTKDELTSYMGPVQYINHHEVMRPDSSSTPCRIVFNFSANYRGHVMNDYWAKSPDPVSKKYISFLR